MLSRAILVCCLSLLGAFFCLPAAAWSQRAADTGKLLDAARKGRPAQRYAAIDDLGELAQEATTVVPTLVKLLDDQDVQVRWRAARSLGDFSAMATSAVPALQKMVVQDEPVARLHAAAALGRIGDKSAATVEALMKQVTGNEPRVARVAIAALRTLQPDTELTVGALAKALESNDTAVTSHAIEAMVESGPAAVPLLKEALQKTSTAYVACVVISEIGPDAAGAVPELTELLAKTTHSKLRIEALLALAKIGPPAKPAAATVLPLLDYQEDVTVPVAAAFALGSIGATDAVGQLRTLEAQQDKPFLSMVAAWSLARLNPSDEAELKRAVDRLTQGLGSDDPMIRAAAAEGLRMLEPPSEMVAPLLLKIANDADPSVRANVQAALASLGPQVVPKAIAALEDPEFRELAIQVLLRLGPDAAEATSALAKLLSSDLKPAVRARAHLALAAIGPAAAAATESLLPALDSDIPRVRHTAMRALHQIGSGAAAARPKLLGILDGADATEAAAAAWTLSTVAGNDADVVTRLLPVMEKSLQHEKPQIRLRTAEALGQLGPAARSALPALQKLAAEDDRLSVRQAAKAAVQEISGS